MTWVAIAVAAYLVYAAWTYATQRQILFIGAELPAPPAEVEPPARIVELDATSPPARAVFVPARDGAEPGAALLLLHGNAEYAHQLTGFVAAYTEAGMHALILEYPGYAGAPGSPSIESVAAAADAAWDWLLERGDVDPGRIVVFGRSVGAGPACVIAQQRGAAALAMFSGFTAIADFAPRYGLPRFLVRDRWDNVACLRDYAGPVLLGHGRRDHIIPFAHSRTLAEAAADAELHGFDCAHNDCGEATRRFAGIVIERLRREGVLRAQPRSASQSPASRSNQASGPDST